MKNDSEILLKYQQRILVATEPMLLNS